MTTFVVVLLWLTCLWCVDAGARDRPNIVLLLTDDQDIMLGSMDVMEKTKRDVVEAGASFRNAFVTSPICCPSRSSILTGLYSHNHNVFTNHDNCSSLLWQQMYENGSFATYLDRAGYATGYFGKYLNEYNGSYTPPGWQYWMGLVKNSKFYNYTLLHNGVKERHGDDYARDYLTDLVGNRSMDFFRESKRLDPNKPVLSVLSFPAPHGPEDGAPQYQHLYANVSSHETASFNYAPNPDKNWLLRRIQGGMDETQRKFSTMLQQKRLQTLRSVDDNVEKFVGMLEEMGELNNTYIIYMSDHGYHIGQYALPKGKTLPYDFDTRIPFYLRGPKISRDISIDNIVLNVDVAPTILDLAGVPVPARMDGSSIMKLFDQEPNDHGPWRESFLIQRGKLPRYKITKPKPLNKLGKTERLAEMCALPTYAFPCAQEQYWTCQNETLEDNSHKLRVQKCRTEKKIKQGRVKKCRCSANQRPELEADDDWLDIRRSCKKRGRGRLEPREFQRRHAKQFRSRATKAIDEYKKTHRQKRGVQRRGRASSNPERRGNSLALTSKCRLYMPNFKIKCSSDIVDDSMLWVNHMSKLARNINVLEFKLRYMRLLSKQLGTCNARNLKIKRRQTPMCECPKKKKKKKIPTLDANISHPLGGITERDRHDAEIGEYQKQKTIQNILREQREEKKRKKLQKGSILSKKKCVSSEEGLTCFKLSENTWLTYPTWEGEEQCYCTSSYKMSYWCLRLINERTNLMYCHFINSGFEEFYNLLVDPHQLYNSVDDLQSYERTWLHSELNRLRGCKGSLHCNAIGTDPPANASFLLEDFSTSFTENINPFLPPVSQNVPMLPGARTSTEPEPARFDIDQEPQPSATNHAEPGSEPVVPQRERRKYSRKPKRRRSKSAKKKNNSRRKGKKATPATFWKPPAEAPQAGSEPTK